MYTAKKIFKMQQDHFKYEQVKKPDKKQPFMEYMIFTNNMKTKLFFQSALKIPSIPSIGKQCPIISLSPAL